MSERETLRKSQDFRRVLNKGKRCRSGGIVLVEASGLPGSIRVGLVVSKGSGNAVTRNRIKRRLRHATRILHLQPGMDYIIIANDQVADVEFEQLSNWLESALTELSDV